MKHAGSFVLQRSVSREAWKGLGEMSTEDAMKNYINELTRINGNWEECIGIIQNITEVNIK
jgi:acyl-CoA-binding protein